MVESAARARLGDLDHHQQDRATALAATAGQRLAIANAIDQLDAALDRTRHQRVLQIIDHPTQLHLDILGPVPQARPAVPSGATKPPSSNSSKTTTAATTLPGIGSSTTSTSRRTLARLADNHIRIDHTTVDPSEWHQVAEHAAALHTSTIARARHIPQRDLEIGLEL